jgi:hypothetical protein
LPRKVSPQSHAQDTLKPDVASADRTRRSASRRIQPKASAEPASEQIAKKKDITLTKVHRYNLAVAAADLDCIRMMSARFNAAPTAYRRIAELKERTVTAHISHFVSKFTFDKEEGIAGCTVSFQIEVTDEKKEELVQANCDFEIHYRGLAREDESAARRCVERLSRFAAYPYFRAFVGHMASLADIRLPVLPVLKERSSTS